MFTFFFCWVYIDSAHIGWSMTSVSSLAELNNEINDEELKKNIKLAFCVAISEIHAVLGYLLSSAR